MNTINNTHMHCVLRNREGATQTSFIPSKFAQVGRFLKLKEGETWTNGLEVIEAFEPMIPSAIVEERSRDYRSHRKATDV